MSNLSSFLFLLRKEILLEWRNQSTLQGILLYSIGTIFLCYISLKTHLDALPPLLWNALFWIIILFSAFMAVLKSFLHETEERHNYYYTLVSAEAIIISKMLYNWGVLLILSVVCGVFYSIMMGNLVQDLILFGVTLFLGSMGISFSLTLVAAIASKAENSTTLMSILGLPILMPLLLMLVKLSKNAIDGLDWYTSWDEIATILSINSISFSLGLLLFPYLWRV